MDGRCEGSKISQSEFVWRRVKNGKVSKNRYMGAKETDIRDRRKRGSAYESAFSGDSILGFG